MTMTPVRLRKRIWIIPKILYATMSNSGWSWTFKLGPWSWNSRARRSRVDLPGPLSYDSGASRRSRTRTRRS